MRLLAISLWIVCVRIQWLKKRQFAWTFFRIYIFVWELTSKWKSNRFQIRDCIMLIQYTEFYTFGGSSMLINVSSFFFMEIGTFMNYQTRLWVNLEYSYTKFILNKTHLTKSFIVRLSYEENGDFKCKPVLIQSLVYL